MAFYLAFIVSSISSGIFSDILCGRSYDILFGISSDIVFGMFFGILYGYVSGRWGPAEVLRGPRRSRSGEAHCDQKLVEEARRGGGRKGGRKEGRNRGTEEGRSRTTNIKSNNPHLAGGEKKTLKFVALGVKFREIWFKSVWYGHMVALGHFSCKASLALNSGLTWDTACMLV